MTPCDFQQLVNEHIRRQRAAHVECCNLPEGDAELTLDETLAVRLYTGPGYQPLNDFLRQLGKLTGAVRAGVAAHAGLTFTATAALLCHAIRKLAAVTSPSELEQPLYRAVRGELPRTFWVEDAQGMIAAVDAGFMSTSKNRETPIHYMSGEANVLWELCPSRESDTAYHRGASVEILSQFPGEEEVLFPPCTMLTVLRGEAGTGDSNRDNLVSSKEPAIASGHAKLGHQQNHAGEPVSYHAIRVRPFFI